jgi:indolepyruvate ferredoxin oxidoreductase, beta subunit
VIASELMEAGRAILRGLVTPDRTTLIASSQRAFAVSEKERPGDGTADSATVHNAASIAAKRRFIADFASLAEANDSVISAALLGAVAASGALPFERSAFEQAIRDSGLGVAASLKAFSAGHEEAERDTPPAVLQPGKDLPHVPHASGIAQLDLLLNRLRADFQPLTQRMIYAGLKHVVDFQDTQYGAEFLDHLAPIARTDHATGGRSHSFALTNEVARQLARAMAYDDVIRVADLKTRTARSARVATEIKLDSERQVVQLTEYFHPRMEEICATLPATLGLAIERRPRIFKALDRVFARPRRVRTDTLWGYLQLHMLAGRKPKRRKTLRHGREMAHIATWLQSITSVAPRNYDLAIELAKSRRLIKGYSDTMSRGLSKYDRVMSAANLVADRADAADWMRRLRQAALMDENGDALDGALKTIAHLDVAPEPAEAS